MYGICNLSTVPGRAEPSDKSEMVTQLLFGDHFQVIQRERKWAYIRTGYEGYECWIDQKQFLPVSQETYNELEQEPLSIATDLVQILTHKETNSVIPVLMGSSLPHFDGEVCNLEGNEYMYEGTFIKPGNKTKKDTIVENAFTYLNAPYLWGGRSPFGIDCSGFTQMAYKLSGFKLPRDAYQQAELGNTLSFVEEAEPGDLAFFDNEQGRITHVGIVLKDNQIIHASGKVRADKLDHYGIYNSEIQGYTHNLRLLRRIV